MTMDSTAGEKNSAAYVTLGSVPLRFELEWPFRKSTSGADFHVLHGRAWLLQDPAAGLHADFAANFSQTVVEALPSLAAEHARDVVINGARMAADSGRLQFLKSGKRLPVEVSSRSLDLKTRQIRFLSASDEQMAEFLKKKLYWLSWRAPQSPAALWIADPCDAQYLGRSPEQLLEAARKLEAAGWCTLEGEFARAGKSLEQHGDSFEAELRKTLERAVAHFNRAMTG